MSSRFLDSEFMILPGCSKRLDAPEAHRGLLAYGESSRSTFQCFTLRVKNMLALRDLLVTWAEINSGSGNIAGLERMHATLASEFATLPSARLLAFISGSSITNVAWRTEK